MPHDASRAIHHLTMGSLVHFSLSLRRFIFFNTLSCQNSNDEDDRCSSYVKKACEEHVVSHGVLRR